MRRDGGAQFLRGGGRGEEARCCFSQKCFAGTGEEREEEEEKEEEGRFRQIGELFTFSSDAET